MVWVAGSAGAFAATEDGGATWRLPSAPLSPYNLRAVGAAAAGEVGWVAGDFGTLLRSADGGVTWQPTPLGRAANYLATHLSGMLG